MELARMSPQQRERFQEIEQNIREARRRLDLPPFAGLKLTGKGSRDTKAAKETRSGFTVIRSD